MDWDCFAIARNDVGVEWTNGGLLLSLLKHKYWIQRHVAAKAHSRTRELTVVDNLLLPSTLRVATSLGDGGLLYIGVR